MAAVVIRPSNVTQKLIHCMRLCYGKYIKPVCQISLLDDTDLGTNIVYNFFRPFVDVYELVIMVLTNRLWYSISVHQML